MVQVSGSKKDSIWACMVDFPEQSIFL